MTPLNSRDDPDSDYYKHQNRGHYDITYICLNCHAENVFSFLYGEIAPNNITIELLARPKSPAWPVSECENCGCLFGYVKKELPREDENSCHCSCDNCKR